MIIEKKIIKYLSDELDVPVMAENQLELSGEHVVIEKTASSTTNKVNRSTIAFQSYADSMLEAAELNERVKAALEGLVILDEVSGVELSTDYNFTDTRKKQYRYQAVYDIYHY